jgi:hypothetical protein
VTVTVNIDSVDESLLVKPDGAKFISEAMHREEDCEATFEGGINGTISVGLREANLDKRDRYRSKVRTACGSDFIVGRSSRCNSNCNRRTNSNGVPGNGHK